LRYALGRAVAALCERRDSTPQVKPAATKALVGGGALGVAAEFGGRSPPLQKARAAGRKSLSQKGEFAGRGW